MERLVLLDVLARFFEQLNILHVISRNDIESVREALNLTSRVFLFEHLVVVTNISFTELTVYDRARDAQYNPCNNPSHGLSHEIADRTDNPRRTVSDVRYDSRSQSHDRIDRTAEGIGHVTVCRKCADKEQHQDDDEDYFEFCHIWTSEERFRKSLSYQVLNNSEFDLNIGNLID